MSQSRRPVFMIGIDAADWEVMQRLRTQHKLPHLSHMLDHGTWGVLDSPADAYAGGVWPDFYTGTPVSQHGIYHNKLWRQDHMRVEVPTDRWLGARPFYERLGALGLRVCAIDVPMVLGQPKPLRGVYLGGWGTHDLIRKGAWPASLWDELCRRFGKPKMPAERFGAQTPRSLLRLRRDLLEATTQITDIASFLLAPHAPDFTCVVFGAAHRAGHYLWDASQVADRATPAQRAAIENALADIYMACDRALGTLIEQAPPNAVTIAFAVHGMTANHGWSDLGARLVESVLSASLGRVPKRSLLYRLRQRVPLHWLRPVLSRLPPGWADRLVRLWSARMYDWSSTPYFPMPMDQAGYVRINLQGRECSGMVKAGEAYETLCQRLEAFWGGLYDVDSGERLVKRIDRAWQRAPADAAARDLLPDILLEWGALALGQTKLLACDRWPEFRFDVPDKTLSGRSGNHIGRGWFVATGAGIGRCEVQGYSIRDLAPTVFALLGADAPTAFTGTPMPLMTGVTHAH